ncbi:MAG: cytochrome c3 family protein [Desulfovibrionaceae bacterium]
MQRLSLNYVPNGRRNGYGLNRRSWRRERLVAWGKAICVLLTAAMLLFGLVLAVSAVADAAEKSADRYGKCVSCHPKVAEQLAAQGGHKPFAERRCGDCHAPHAAKYADLLRKDAAKLCVGCHKDKAAENGAGSVHQPYGQGKCLSCHNPHASPNAKLLKAQDEGLCFGCHDRKKGFSERYGHDPVAKGKCLGCHAPHASSHKALARKDRRALCGSCHAAEGAALKKAHGGLDTKGTDCASCHDPHGAARRDLVRPVLHDPFAGRQCRACHVETGKELKANDASLCLGCHPKVKEAFMASTSHIGPGVFCVSCHAPHASGTKSLTRGDERAMCFGCHADTQKAMQARGREYKHPMVTDGKCSSCHSPHGAQDPTLFAKGEIAVCTACHERHVTFTHPLGDKALDPRSKTPLTCVTCHNLMGSPNPYALRFNRDKELCLQCHRGY